MEAATYTYTYILYLPLKGARCGPGLEALAPVEEDGRQDAPGAAGSVHGEGVDGVVHLAAFAN